jgi:predicted membrane-bound dolichyl-phosphate-mannose-protein mannosyltransferase
LDLIPVIVLLALYLGLAYLTHATQGFYVYPFLDLHKNSSGSVGAYIVGILVAAIIIFLIVRYLIVLRVWITEKKLGKTGKTSTRQNSAGADEFPLHNTTAK